MASATSSDHAHRRRERSDRSACTSALVAQLVEAEGEHRDALLAELIEVNLPVAHSIAGRYRSRGIPAEDLEQVAAAALVRSAQRFDPASGHDFLSYAVPSMRGEVRRYFRDSGWMVRPPRRIQELQSRMSAAESDLSTSLGRPPHVEELADRLEEDVPDVVEAQAANGCFTPTSLDQGTGDGRQDPIGDLLGADDTGYDAAEARTLVMPAIERLGERDRRIVALRFFGQRTQQEIADEIGVTQMQVSRLLAGILQKLRRDLTTPAPAA